MFPIDTQLVYWTCPDCHSKQEIILVLNMELPPELECDDCGHKSDGEIIWEAKE